MTVREQSILPYDVEQVCTDIGVCTDEYQIIRPAAEMETFRVRLEVEVDGMVARESIENRYEAEIGVPVDMEFVEAGALSTDHYKSARVIEE